MIPVLPHYLQSSLLPLLPPTCLGLESLVAPYGPICTCSALLSLSWLWPHGLCDPFGPPLSLKKDATRPAPSLEGSGPWTLSGEDFWCFVSFRAKENRLIKTSEPGEVLAAASHIGFIAWILFSLGFQIFLSYYFSCHILTVSSVTHSLLVPALWKNFSTVLHFISTIIISGFPVRHSELVWGTEKWKEVFFLISISFEWGIFPWWILFFPLLSLTLVFNIHLSVCDCVCDLHLLDF